VTDDVKHGHGRVVGAGVGPEPVNDTLQTRYAPSSCPRGTVGVTYWYILLGSEWGGQPTGRLYYKGCLTQ
jgi:hypothetical protein